MRARVLIWSYLAQFFSEW